MEVDKSPDIKSKKVWSKPICYSGKDFGFFGLIQATGPYGTPS